EKYFHWQLGAIAAQHYPLEPLAAAGQRIVDMHSCQRLSALATRLDRCGEFGVGFADDSVQAGIAQKTQPTRIRLQDPIFVVQSDRQTSAFEQRTELFF